MAENCGRECRKSCKQLTSTGKLIRIYKSHNEASRKTKINQSSITQCTLGKYKTAGGYKWVNV